MSNNFSSFVLNISQILVSIYKAIFLFNKPVVFMHVPGESLQSCVTLCNPMDYSLPRN